jgi:hypothetical protein
MLGRYQEDGMNIEEFPEIDPPPPPKTEREQKIENATKAFQENAKRISNMVLTHCSQISDGLVSLHQAILRNAQPLERRNGRRIKSL